MTRANSHESDDFVFLVLFCKSRSSLLMKQWEKLTVLISPIVLGPAVGLSSDCGLIFAGVPESRRSAC